MMWMLPAVFITNYRQGELQKKTFGNDVVRIAVIYPIFSYTWSLNLNTHLDRESKPFHNVTIYAARVFERQTPVVLEREIVVKVLDSNDNSPRFDKPVYRVTLNKVIANDQDGSDVFVSQVSATDLDDGANSKLMYFIENYKDLFKVDKYSGSVFYRKAIFLRAIEQNPRSRFDIVIRAQDLAKRGSERSGLCVLRLYVDISDKYGQQIKHSGSTAFLFYAMTVLFIMILLFLILYLLRTAYPWLNFNFFKRKPHRNYNTYFGSQNLNRRKSKMFGSTSVSPGFVGCRCELRKSRRVFDFIPKIYAMITQPCSTEWDISRNYGTKKFLERKRYASLCGHHTKASQEALVQNLRPGGYRVVDGFGSATGTVHPRNCCSECRFFVNDTMIQSIENLTTNFLNAGEVLLQPTCKPNDV
ncbi:hypothetical protein ACOME3_002844 [Neoechinorhynchus agilis]